MSELIYSDAVPRNTILIGAHDAGVRMTMEPLRLYRDPWPPAPSGWSETARDERRKGLDWLAARLDGLCAAIGADPQRVWRFPKETEAMRKALAVTYVAEMRYGLQVNRPGDYRAITGIV